MVCAFTCQISSIGTVMKLNDDILEAIARHDINLELGTGWQAEVNQNEAWISNESGKSIFFSAHCAEHRLIRVLTDTTSVSSKTYPVASMVRLIEIGALRIAHQTVAESSHRFKWQDEYFSAFASPTNSLKDINNRMLSLLVLVDLAACWHCCSHQRGLAIFRWSMVTSSKSQICPDNFFSRNRVLAK